MLLLQTTSLQRKEARLQDLSVYVHYWKNRKKERNGLTNTMFSLLSTPSVLITTFQYLQSQGELICIIIVIINSSTL